MIIKTKRDSLGCHHFDCPKCKVEGFVGFWMDTETDSNMASTALQYKL